MSSLDQAMDRIIEKSCMDPDFRMRLKDDPRATLREFGVEIPDDVEIAVLEDTPRKLNLTLPADPWIEIPSDAELELSITAPGMSLCSQSNSCCCGFGDVIEEAA